VSQCPRRIHLAGVPDNPHTYHFIPDVAESLKQLGTGPDEILGRPWMLPCAPAETSRELVDRFARVLGPWSALCRQASTFPIAHTLGRGGRGSTTMIGR